jgi:DNA ligase-1
MTTLNEGETLKVPGSGSAVHTIKRSGGVYSCSCPAWRNQSLPPDVRSCKHMVKMGFTNTPGSDELDELPTIHISQVPKLQDPPPVLLAHSWDTVQDLTGWWVSEKFDGVRCWWDGTQFISRLGNPFHAPKWFTENLPRTTLDGELWIGRKLFQLTVGAVKKLNPIDAEWRNIRFMVFDAPGHGGEFEERVAHIKTILQDVPHTEPVHHVVCKGTAHIREMLKDVQALGGEGLMLRAPRSKYEAGRSNTLLKVKEFFDAEGTVTGYEPGKGKHKGRVGALLMLSDSGETFSVGTGLSDREREKPPSIGSRVTYRYQELTQDNKPRFPVFVSARDYE